MRKKGRNILVGADQLFAQPILPQEKKKQKSGSKDHTQHRHKANENLCCRASTTV